MATGIGAGGREQVHGMWAAVAPAWGEHADAIDARAAVVTARMLARTAPATGERVLELACGAGGTGLAAAQRVGPAGEVVVTDVVEGMARVAADRARALGLTCVSTRVRDLDDIDEPDASFDVVLCREGLMFAGDPSRAVGGIRRVLRPGGRMAVAVWGPRARNPWLGLVFDAVTAHVGAPVPPPGVPGPFSLDDADRLTRILRDAGLRDVGVEEVEVPLVTRSAEEWWARAVALAGPLALRLRAMAPDEREGLRARALAAAAPFSGPEAIAMPGVSLVAWGRARSGGGA